MTLYSNAIISAYGTSRLDGTAYLDKYHISIFIVLSVGLPRYVPIHTASYFSISNASYTLIHEILSTMNKKHIVGGIFCDLSKAFDCVNHRILLSKLEHYEIRGKFGALIKSYLTERYERAAIRDKTNTTNYSNWELVRHGVPQGSILGPLLFF